MVRSVRRTTAMGRSCPVIVVCIVTVDRRGRAPALGPELPTHRQSGCRRSEVRSIARLAAPGATALPPLPLPDDTRPRRGAATGGRPSRRRRRSAGSTPYPRPGDPADRPGQRPAPGGRARPGHRHRPAAGLAGPGRPGGGPRALAPQPLHRADLLPPRRASPGDQRPGPDGHRDSLFLGTTATLANSFPAPPPGSGYPPLNSLSGVLRISDAIYGTRAARRVIAANEAGVAVATNNALLAASEAYFDLQLAAGTLAIAREAAGNAEVLAGITGTYARSGAGLEADHRRILTELRSRQRCHPGRRRAAGGRLGRAGPPARARPARRGRPGRAGRDRHPARRRRRPARRPDLPGLAEPPRAGAGPGAGRGDRAAAQAGEAPPLRPEPRGLLLGGRLRGGPERVLRQLRRPERRRREPVLGAPGPRPRRPRPSAAARRPSRHTADIDLVRVQAQVANDVVAAYKARAAAAGPDGGGARSRSPRRSSRWS